MGESEELDPERYKLEYIEDLISSLQKQLGNKINESDINTNAEWVY